MGGTQEVEGKKKKRRRMTDILNLESELQRIPPAPKKSVFLAYIDAPIKENDTVTIEDSFIGGEPLWLHPDSTPPESMLTCKACNSNKHMKLLLQAFSPLDYEQVEELQVGLGRTPNMKYVNGNDDRVLYVFICTKCQRRENSVRCIRGVKKNTPSKGGQLTGNMEKNLAEASSSLSSLTMGDGLGFANPFDLSQGNSSANPFATGASNPFGTVKASEDVANTDKPEPELSKKMMRKLHDGQKDRKFDAKRAFKGYFLYVEDETFNNKPDYLKLPKNLKIDKEALDLTGQSEEDLEKDPVKLDPRTEKLSKFLDDEVFQKFQEIIGYNPGQVLRYDLGGKPLYYSSTEVAFEKIVAAPSYNPHSCRVFEMQLMPKMIMDLEEDVSITGGMEWGTIMVFSDIENYVPKFDEHNVGYVEEVVKVQWEN